MSSIPTKHKLSTDSGIAALQSVSLSLKPVESSSWLCVAIVVAIALVTIGIGALPYEICVNISELTIASILVAQLCKKGFFSQKLQSDTWEFGILISQILASIWGYHTGYYAHSPYTARLYNGGEQGLISRLGDTGAAFGLYALASRCTSWSNERKLLPIIVSALGVVALSMIEEARNLSLGTSDPRLQATFTNPDLLGAYACLTLPLILAYATESGITWKYRVVRGWLVKAMIAMTILTQSRGAIIACAIGCLFVSAKHMHPRFALLKSQTKLTFAAIISAAILIPLALMPHFLHQGRSVSDAQRFTTWRGAVTIIKSHPIFGLGTGAFPAALASLRLREPIEGSSIPNASEVSVHLHSHDIFLQWWIEQGMLGLILAIALIGIAAKKAIQIFAAKNITPDPIALGASAALVAILCENVPDYTLWFTPIWLIFGYVFGLAASDDKVKVTPELKLLN